MSAAGPGRLPALAVAVSAVMWGSWWLPLRWLAERGLPGDWASLAIYTLATAMLVPLAWRRRRRLWAGGFDVLLVGVLFGPMLVLWNHAILVGEVVRVVLLFYLAPVWASLFAITILGQRVGPGRAVSVALGLSGAAVVLGFEGGWPVPCSSGDWLGLLSGVMFGLAATMARRAEAIADFDKTFASFVAAAVAAFALAATGLAPTPSGSDVIGGMPLAAGVVALWVLPATWLVFWGATRLDPGRVSILLLLEVVTAVITASLLSDEPFGWREAGGCALILLAGLVEAMPSPRSSAG